MSIKELGQYFTINKKLSFTIHKVSTRKILEVVVSGVKSQ